MSFLIPQPVICLIVVMTKPDAIDGRLTADPSLLFTSAKLAIEGRSWARRANALPQLVFPFMGYHGDLFEYCSAVSQPVWDRLRILLAALVASTLFCWFVRSMNRH
jgi:hypothetical protein